MGRPYRRLRRWVRHTPTNEIAVTLIGIGTALIFIAVVVGFLLL